MEAMQQTGARSGVWSGDKDGVDGSRLRVVPERSLSLYWRRAVHECLGDDVWSVISMKR